jgi:hypothetical protein
MIKIKKEEKYPLKNKIKNQLKKEVRMKFNKRNN